MVYEDAIKAVGTPNDWSVENLFAMVTLVRFVLVRGRNDEMAKKSRQLTEGLLGKNISTKTKEEAEYLLDEPFPEKKVDVYEAFYGSLKSSGKV